MIYKDKPCPHCGRFTNRGVSIDALIIKNNKILLIKRGVEPFKGYWGTPGGYVGWDETAEQATIREAEEETGLKVNNVRFVKFSSAPNRHPQQTMNVVFLADIAGGNLKSGDDARGFKWFDLDDLPENLAFDHKENIEAALKLLKSNKN